MEGIYKIINKINGKYYLGSTKNFRKRKLRHLNELRKGVHHNIHLQRAFVKYGEENFKFILIEKCTDIIDIEQGYLDTLDYTKCYNISKTASGGFLIGNHPDKEKILAKAKENLLKAPNRGSVVGDKNPNWKGGKTFCKCGKRINSNTKVCMECTDRKGEKNSFYNKKHTQETKDKLSNIRKGTYNGNQRRAVIILGEEFISVTEASKKIGVVPATIINRIKSENFSEYVYK